MSKRILVIGVLPKEHSLYTYTLSFIRAFIKLGYDVVPFDYRVNSSAIMNLRLRYIVHKQNPDIIFVVKGERLWASTIRWIKKNSGACLVNFYPDNPFTLWNGNSNQDVLMSLPLYDQFLIWSEQLIPLLKAAGAQNVHYFPFGFDKEVFSVVSDKYDYQSDYDVCFVGSWEPVREQWLGALLQARVTRNIIIWGDRWDNAQDKHVRSAVKGNAIYYKKLVDTLQKSKIVLNFLRAQNMNAHNMRTMEVPACGSFLLTQRTTEQANKLFKEGESIGCFSSQDECIEKVNWYLCHEQERQAIAFAGNERVQVYELTTLLRKFFLLN